MLPTQPIQAQTVTIDSAGIPVPAYLAQPTTPGPWPIVVVLQEVFGVNAHIRAVTERVAKGGYIAISPHLYHRQIPHFEVGYSEADLALGRHYKLGTHAQEILSDVEGAIVYGQTHCPGMDTGAGCIGFCFGGHGAYLAATLPQIKATASFYGAGIATSTPGGGPPTLSKTAEISGLIYIFFGKQDPLISAEEVMQIEAELSKYDIHHQVFKYERAGHGFCCDQRSSYHPEAASHAWQQVERLFQQALQP